MNDVFRREQERRAFTRVKIRAPVEIRQGADRWRLELLNISLTGLAVTEPEDWEPDYQQPFDFLIYLNRDEPLEVRARIIYINPGYMGFEMEPLAEVQRTALAEVLATYLGQDLIREELNFLAELEREGD